MHFYNWKAWAILGSWQVLYPLLAAFKWYWFEEKERQKAAFISLHGNINLFPFLRFIFFGHIFFVNDHRYFWGFVLHGSIFLLSFNLQCSQNAETLWHGDNFLSNRQYCQQCRFVINCRIQPRAGFAGLRETPAVGSEICVWVSIHLLSRCAYFFSSCSHPFTR